MKERYKKSVGALTPDEIAALAEKKVFIAGCGGLGGYSLEMLARLGVLNITVADGDVFTESNLNRQILCTEKNLGAGKAEAARGRIAEINPEVKLTAHQVFIGEDNALELLAGHDLIIDALDNIASRLLLERAAEKLGIPLIHGAIQDWFAQIAVIMPGDRTLEKLYGASVPQPPSVPSFTPALCASLQVSEAVKLLCGRGTLKKGQVMIFELCDKEINTFTV